MITQTKEIKKEDDMMPLSMIAEGQPSVIRKQAAKKKHCRFLENLGFVVGGTVTVISQIGGNMIVNVKDARVAIGKDMANKIMVQKGEIDEDIKRSCMWRNCKS